MIEKGLAEKVMFAIYTDSQKEEEKCYANYIAYTNLLGKKANNELLSKTSSHHANYQVKKAKERIKENE